MKSPSIIAWLNVGFLVVAGVVGIIAGKWVLGTILLALASLLGVFVVVTERWWYRTRHHS